MALLTVQGIYRDGKIELAETPSAVPSGSPVLVTFLPASQTAEATANVPSGRARQEAGLRLLALLARGLPLGGPPYPEREELYDRVDRVAERTR